MKPQARLMIADSEHDADMLYASGMFVPDAFVAVALNVAGTWQWHGLFSALEFDRAKQESAFHQLHPAAVWDEAARQQGWKVTGLVAQAMAFLHAHDCRDIEVPGHFSLHYADTMRQHGFRISATTGSFFPERICKTTREVEELAHAEQLTRQSMTEAERFLAACRIGNDGLLYHPETDDVVYARDVRKVIECWLIGEGAMPAHTIVACGAEGADPHCVGHGVIRAHTPIIIDIFPRLMRSGYWGDMTRTYVRGKASEAVKRQYQAVKEAQAIGLEMLGEGIDGQHIHQRIQQHFDTAGFITGTRDGRQCGFFHGTGHGVGLEIHEAPRISRRSCLLQAGHVVTVEPGLYYAETGGVRLEDLCLITSSGHRNLTCHPCELEIG